MRFAKRDGPDMFGPIAKLCIGYVLVFIHIFTDVTSLACVQMVKGAVSDFQLSAIRLFIQSLGSLVFIQWNNNFYKLARTDMTWIAVVVFSYITFNIGFFGASKCLPLADHGSLNNLLTFIFIGFLLWIFKSEAPGKVNILAIIVCFTGTVMIVQPSYLFDSGATKYNESTQGVAANLSSSNSSQYDIIATDLQATPYCYTLLVLGSASAALFLFGLEHRLNHINTPNQIFWMSLGALIYTLPLTFYMEPINVEFIFNLKETLLVLGHSILAGVTIALGLVSLHLLGGLRFSIVLSLTITMQLAFQYTLLASYQPGNKNVLAVSGVFVVVIGIALPVVLVGLKEKFGGPSDFIMKDMENTKK